MSRQTSSVLVETAAECGGCSWTSSASNALGNAARHHDATGHHVEVLVSRIVHYGDANAPAAGQLDLVTELEAGPA